MYTVRKRELGIQWVKQFCMVELSERKNQSLATKAKSHAKTG